VSSDSKTKKKKTTKKSKNHTTDATSSSEDEDFDRSSEEEVIIMEARLVPLRKGFLYGSKQNQVIQVVEVDADVNHPLSSTSLNPMLAEYVCYSYSIPLTMPVSASDRAFLRIQLNLSIWFEYALQSNVPKPRIEPFNEPIQFLPILKNLVLKCTMGGGGCIPPPFTRAGQKAGTRPLSGLWPMASCHERKPAAVVLRSRLLGSTQQSPFKKCQEAPEELLRGASCKHPGKLLRWTPPSPTLVEALFRCS
jgi:hypothetical protein